MSTQVTVGGELLKKGYTEPLKMKAVRNTVTTTEKKEHYNVCYIDSKFLSKIIQNT